MAVKKILCPFHEESTPSCCIYPESMSFICFGCGRKGHIKDLPTEHLMGLEVSDFIPKPREDLRESIGYVKTLPTGTIRGLQLPYNHNSFYIVWPDNSYYLRRFTDGSEPKYVGPSGHDRPIYRASTARSSTLVLTEGELNAASIALGYPEANVISIGGTGNFTQARLTKHLSEWQRYDTIVVLLDDDPAGTLAAIEACAFFKSLGKVVVLRLLQKDMNKVLEYEGKEQVRRAMESYLRREVAGDSEEW